MSDPWRGYYLTAYGIAVKHGFTGTEEEWLESLVGAAVEEMRHNKETHQFEWRREKSDVWLPFYDTTQIEGAAEAAAAAKRYAEDAARVFAEAEKKLEQANQILEESTRKAEETLARAEAVLATCSNFITVADESFADESSEEPIELGLTWTELDALTVVNRQT